MKNLFKVLIASFMLIVLSAGVFGQQTLTAPATATVLTNLTIALETGTSINFGNISATTPAAIVLDANGVTNANTGSTTDVAQFNIVGAPAASITVRYDATVTLTETVGNTLTMVMTPDVVGDAAVANMATAAAVVSGTQKTLAAVTGTYFLWVGGSIPALTNQGAGIYAGVFNTEIEYN